MGLFDEMAYDELKNSDELNFNDKNTSYMYKEMLRDDKNDKFNPFGKSIGNFDGVDKMQTGTDKVGIGDLTIGISHKGMEKFQEELKSEILTKTKDVINDTKELEAAINKSWQGVSRDVWMSRFNDMRSRIVNDLEKEYYDLKARLEELEDNYYNQDSNMIKII